MNKLLIFFSVLCIPFYGLCQGMAVNTTGTAAASSAILDVSSTSQGVLVPRMLSSERSAIPSPASGLLVYQTDGTPGFYYYNGTAWTSLSGGGSSTDHGTIGGGIFFQTLALQTTPQSYDLTGTTNRLLVFDMANDPYWGGSSGRYPTINLTLGAPNLYPPGTEIKMQMTGSSYPGYAATFTINSPGATFYGFDYTFSGSVNSLTFYSGIFTLITDGVSKWVLFL